MNYALDHQTLTIALCGRIDSANAAACEEALLQICKENTYTFLTLDANKLEYIASAGLRVVLKLIKTNPHIKMINVSSEVYDILQMTGFTDLLTVKRSMRQISVKDKQWIAQGRHGVVYRLDAETIVKVYVDNTTVDEIQDELNRAKRAFIQGIPTAISYDIVRCDDKIGVVFEMLHAQTLAKQIEQHPDKMEAYAQKFVNLLKSVNAIKVSDDSYENTKDIYNAWVDGMAKYLPAHEVDILHSMIDAIPDRQTLIHGDYHLGNVMVQDDELVLIDMGDISKGHPLFDLAGTSLVMVFAREASHQVTGINPELCHQFWIKVLSCYFHTEQPELLEQINNMCRLLALIKFSVTPVMGNVTGPMLTNVVAAIRERAIPNAPNIIHAISVLGAMIDTTEKQ